MNHPKACYYCGAGDQRQVLRPYGPGGSDVCLSCVLDPAHPEREAAAAAVFTAQAAAAAAVSPRGMVVLDGTTGPNPY